MLEGSNRLPLPPFESETGGNSLPPTGQDENLTNIKNNPRPSTLLYEASETRAKPICFDLFSMSFKTASRGSSSFSLKRETPPDRRRTGEDSIKRPGEFIVSAWIRLIFIKKRAEIETSNFKQKKKNDSFVTHPISINIFE